MKFLNIRSLVFILSIFVSELAVCATAVSWTIIPKQGQTAAEACVDAGNFSPPSSVKNHSVSFAEAVGFLANLSFDPFSNNEFQVCVRLQQWIYALELVTYEFAEVNDGGTIRNFFIREADPPNPPANFTAPLTVSLKSTNESFNLVSELEGGANGAVLSVQANQIQISYNGAFLNRIWSIFAPQREYEISISCTGEQTPHNFYGVAASRTDSNGVAIINFSSTQNWPSISTDCLNSLTSFEIEKSGNLDHTGSIVIFNGSSEEVRIGNVISVSETEATGASSYINVWRKKAIDPNNSENQDYWVTLQEASSPDFAVSANILNGSSLTIMSVVRYGINASGTVSSYSEWFHIQALPGPEFFSYGSFTATVSAYNNQSFSYDNPEPVPVGYLLKPMDKLTVTEPLASGAVSYRNVFKLLLPEDVNAVGGWVTVQDSSSPELIISAAHQRLSSLTYLQVTRIGENSIGFSHVQTSWFEIGPVSPPGNFEVSLLPVFTKEGSEGAQTALDDSRSVQAGTIISAAELTAPGATSYRNVFKLLLLEDVNAVGGWVTVQDSSSPDLLVSAQHQQAGQATVFQITRIAINSGGSSQIVSAWLYIAPVSPPGNFEVGALPVFTKEFSEGEPTALDESRLVQAGTIIAAAELTVSGATSYRNVFKLLLPEDVSAVGGWVTVQDGSSPDFLVSAQHQQAGQGTVFQITRIAINSGGSSQIVSAWLYIASSE